MPFDKLMYFMLGMVKESTQNALDRYFPKMKEGIHMSQQAFSEARQKVKWEAFSEMLRESVLGSYSEELVFWRGFRLFAIDSSHVALPRDEELRKYFGATGHELTAPTARASMLYDIMNDIIADALLKPLSEGERELAKLHLDALDAIERETGKQKNIVILDRGYPSLEFIKYLQDRGIKYVMRVKRGFNAEVDGVKEGSSKTIMLKGGIVFRALAFWLESGEREALITNLEEGELEDGAFKELYHKRWPIETKYNQLKQKLELENFSGRLVKTVMQDFYAMATVSNMLAACLREANREVKEERAGKEVKYEYRVNVNHAVGVLKDRLIEAIMPEDSRVRTYLYDELVREMKRRLVPVRLGRKVKRKEYLKKPHFHHNHKSNC